MNRCSVLVSLLSLARRMSTSSHWTSSIVGVALALLRCLRAARAARHNDLIDLRRCHMHAYKSIRQIVYKCNGEAVKRSCLEDGERGVDGELNRVALSEQVIPHVERCHVGERRRVDVDADRRRLADAVRRRRLWRPVRAQKRTNQRKKQSTHPKQHAAQTTYGAS